MSLMGRTVLVTGVSGNLGTRLLPFLTDFHVVGVDLRPPATASSHLEFRSIDLGREVSCLELTSLIRDTGVTAIVHLAFVLDPQRNGITDSERMWQINVAGSARVMEAISVVNRTGGDVRQFIFPSSVSAYGPETPGPVGEDAPLNAYSLPYAIHKKESDEVVRYRAETLGECRTYILRPHIYTGATMQNYMVGALRGTPLGKSARAARMRANGERLPVLLPRGKEYLGKQFQFVHVDDMARLMTYLLDRPASDPPVTVLNVAGRGEPLTLEACARMANATVKRVPNRMVLDLALRMMWKLRISSIPPEALPYLIGSYTMDTSRLQQFLGPDYPAVIRYTNEEALRDTLAPG